MKKYLINIKKTEFGSLSVMANNEKEAKMKAFFLEEKGGTTWHQSEIKVTINKNKLINYN